ncbi:pyridoxal phosphate-dependent transferase [Infundibulicybe gibba]|nr:pyridoxal phosphate-dependent transferase [Infundibulicybe gibba]
MTGPTLIYVIPAQGPVHQASNKPIIHTATENAHEDKGKVLDAEEVIANSKDHPHKKHAAHLGRTHHQSWSRDEDGARAPKYTMPEFGMPAKAAYQLLHDETALDGNPLLNLASFVHTWMPEEADKLITENMNKNQVDLDEYPAATIIHNRCISMLADLWKAPEGGKVIGTSTAGSSEAIMLGGLAMKKRWQESRKAAGKDHYHPNIVFGSNAQVALEKFARYFDVETRLVPVKAEGDYIMNPQDALEYIDENTIGVMVIFGSTYTGHFEDVQEMSRLLDELQAEKGFDIPIHVDAASGGFMRLVFDVPRVVSINTSGHKLDWNFSKPAAPIISQMFNFLNLGFDGYKKIANKDLRNARLLSRALEKTYFNNIHRPATPSAALGKGSQHPKDDSPEYYQMGLPVVSFKLSDEFKEKYPYVKQVWIQTLLRVKGWIVPNYNGPKGAEDTEILRVVVRETLSEDLIERLIVDLLETTESLMTSDGAAANMMASTTALDILKNRHQPDREHGRPNEDNFGDAETGTKKEQAGFSRQC